MYNTTLISSASVPQLEVQVRAAALTETFAQTEVANAAGQRLLSFQCAVRLANFILSAITVRQQLVESWSGVHIASVVAVTALFPLNPRSCE